MAQRVWTQRQAVSPWRTRAKGRGKPVDGTGIPGACLTVMSAGQARPDRLALNPYWGELTVRNFREGNGDNGIIRSPVRAIALPDLLMGPIREVVILFAGIFATIIHGARAAELRGALFDALPEGVTITNPVAGKKGAGVAAGPYRVPVSERATC